MIFPYQEVLFQKIHLASVTQNHGFVKEIPSHKCHLSSSSSVWALTKAFETKLWRDKHWELGHNNNSPKKPYFYFPHAAPMRHWNQNYSNLLIIKNRHDNTVKCVKPKGAWKVKHKLKSIINTKKKKVLISNLPAKFDGNKQLAASFTILNRIATINSKIWSQSNWISSRPAFKAPTLKRG